MSTRPGMAVNWYKEGARVLPTPRIQMRGAIMEITDVTYEDSGVYVCVLRGSKEPVRNFTITVAGKSTRSAVLMLYWIFFIYKVTGLKKKLLSNED